ncbi:hypothetical protein R3P38DRAFT_2937566 [Favolaschia claudopus]|uniref:MYND-type domain-containing protein n=1 Tax=Favolaschia claudopus TaxID=2862362 RepID=A0AAW0BPL6_9AGAR
MHESLRLSDAARSKIPLQFRRSAIAAATPSACLKERAIFMQNFTRIPWTIDVLVPFLPVLYALLDPIRILSISSDLDGPGDVVQDSHVGLEMFCVTNSLRGIMTVVRANRVPLGAFSDIWKSVWPWLQFVETYHEILTVDLIADRYEQQVLFIAVLGGKPDAAKTMATDIVEICVFLGRAWAHLLQADDRDNADTKTALIVLPERLRFWTEHPDWTRSAADGLILGAGGSTADLALLAISHLNRFLPNKNSPLDQEHNSVAVGSVMTFIERTTREAQPRFARGFADVLFEMGLVTSLTNLSRAVFDGFLPANMSNPTYYDYLLAFLSPCPRHQRVVEALRAGFLSTVPQAGIALPRCRETLFKTLLSVTTLHSSLSQIRASLGQIKDLNEKARFIKESSPPFYKSWLDFMAVLEDRFQALDAYNEGRLNVPIRCHNHECGGTFHRQEIKICSGCTIAYYCSKACQQTDWPAGHRLFCSLISWRNRRDCHPEHPPMTARDDSFLHTLLYWEFRSRQKEIALGYLRFMQNQPDKTPYMLLDFRHGACQIQIDGIEELDSALTPVGMVAVATRNERILFNVMRGLEHHDIIPRLFPPFVAGREFLAGLRTIAAGMPSGAGEEQLEQYCPAVMTLMETDAGDDMEQRRLVW